MIKLMRMLRIFLTILIIALLSASITALLLWDLLVGAVTISGVSAGIFSGISVSGVGVSLATTGALFFLVYLLRRNSSSAPLLPKWVLYPLSAGVYAIDEYFDAIAADFLLFGAYLPLKDVEFPSIVISARLLFALLSSVGEAMAIELLINGWAIFQEILLHVMGGGSRGK